MVDYVEFPVDLLREIVIPRKPDDGGGGGGGGGEGPCGALTWNDQITGGIGIWSLQGGGLYYIVSSPDKILVYSPASAYDASGGLDPSKTYYLWSKPSLFVITATTIPYEEAGFVVDLPFAITVWRNQNPQTFNPCNDRPTIVREGGPSAEEVNLSVEPQTVAELYPPIFMVTGQGEAHCKKVGIPIRVQGKCQNETDDTIPVQPDGYPKDSAKAGQLIGPALGGSIFLTGYL